MRPPWPPGTRPLGSDPHTRRGHDHDLHTRPRDERLGQKRADDPWVRGMYYSQVETKCPRKLATTTVGLKRTTSFKKRVAKTCLKQLWPSIDCVWHDTYRFPPLHIPFFLSFRYLLRKELSLLSGTRQGGHGWQRCRHILTYSYRHSLSISTVFFL